MDHYCRECGSTGVAIEVESKRCKRCHERLEETEDE